MRTKFCLATLLTLMTFSQGCLTAAQAQPAKTRPAAVQNKFANTSGQYDTSDLPPVKFFNARRKIQVVNENPEMTNCMDLPTNKPNLDGMQIPFSMPVDGSGGAGGAGSGVPAGFYPAGSFPWGSMGNPMVPSRSSLPKSRLGPSNINQSLLHPQQCLPYGQSTAMHGRLAGAVPVQTGPTTIRIGHPNAGTAQAPDAGKPTLHYIQPVSTTVATAGGATAKTRVTGVLKSMLDHQR